jgi:hypothetical protein
LGQQQQARRVQHRHRQRFVVTVKGNAPSMDVLKGAASGVDLASLDRMGRAASLALILD